MAAPAPNQPNALSQRKAPEAYHFRTDKGPMGTINMVLGIILIVITLLLVLLAGLAILIMSLSGEPILGMSIFMICTVRICVGIAVANIMIS